MNRNRFSRGLVAILVVVLIAGAGLYVRGVLKARLAMAHSTNPSTKVSTTPSVKIAVSPPTTAPAQLVGASQMQSPSQSALKSALQSPVVTETPSIPPVSALPPTMMAQTPATSQPAAALAAWSPTPAAIPPPPPSNFLAEAAAKTSTGDVLGARKMLNDALLSGSLSPADITSTKKAIADLNETIIFGPRKFPSDEFGGVYPVKPGEQMKKIAENADLTWQFLAKINGLSDPRKMRSGVSLKVVKGPFNVVVNKKAFTMDIYLGGTPGQPGSMYVRSYSVGLGREDSTPTGTWLVEAHHKIMDPTYYSPRGEGVIAANDPKNPLGHRWIGLAGVDGRAVGQQSYGIHGTIDPDSIGKQASMGCIRMHNEDVEVVFDLLAEGKSMVIVKD